MRLRLLAEAETEIESARQYLNLQVLELGTRFLDDLDLTLQEISLRPASFPKLETLPDDQPYRRALLSDFRYAVIYECLDEEIVVVAVAHTSRRPSYWLNRRSQG